MDWIWIIIGLVVLNWVVLPYVLGWPSFFKDLTGTNYASANYVRRYQ